VTIAPKHASIEPTAFRRALGNFATGVTIVTAIDPEGTRVGVTANSFSSLSMDPPLILWSSKKDARSSPVFEAAANFAVNILASDQLELSNHFARQQEDKFRGVEWGEGIGGVPILPNCAGRFQCESYDKLDGGDHWIFVGRVIAFDDSGRSPLCFHQGSYAMVLGRPGSFPRASQMSAQDADQGRMANHAFFLMLRALRAYQDRYQPKIETVGLSLIESRALLVLNDLSGLCAEELIAYLNTPIVEVQAVLSNLHERALVTENRDGYRLTEEGKLKAEECWRVAERHAEETFERFTPEQVGVFTEVLRQLID
jgi:flavin reductase (DIM6/NTAB) family NADH-FMN oxidoreductase RutF